MVQFAFRQQSSQRLARADSAACLIGDDLEQRVQGEHGIDFDRGFRQRAQYRSALLLSSQRLQ